jgi:hypothetical protein
MGMWWDTHRVVLSLRGPPARIHEIVRRGTDAAFFRLLGQKGVRWPPEWGPRPWRAVLPGGEALVAAFDTALPAKDAELAAALLAYEVYTCEDCGMEPDEVGDVVDRDMDTESLNFIAAPSKDHESGRALRALYRRDHPLLRAWSLCCCHGDEGWACTFGFGECEVGFTLEEYALGGDYVRFSFGRYGISWGYDETFWDGYNALHDAMPRDLSYRVLAEARNERFSVGVLADGVKTGWCVPWALQYPNEFQRLEAASELVDEFFAALAKKSASGQQASSYKEDADAEQASTTTKDLCFFDFCCVLDPEACLVAREWSADGYEMLCVQRGIFTHAARIIQRAFRGATADPAFAMCRRRLARLFSAYRVPELAAARVACDGVLQPDSAFGPLFTGTLAHDDAQAQPGALQLLPQAHRSVADCVDRSVF